MVCQKLNYALTYQKSRGAHMSNEWKWVAWYEYMTTWTFHILKAWNNRKSIIRILKTIQCSKCWRFNMIQLKSSKWWSIIPDINLQCLANRHPVWPVIIYCDKSFNSSWIMLIRQHLQPPFTDTCRIFSKCLANQHPVWRVIICCDKLFNSSPFVSIQQHFQPPITDTCGIFSKSFANWLPVCLFTS